MILMSRKPSPSQGKYAAIQVTPEAKNHLVEWLKLSVLKPQQGQVVSALIGWFYRQEPLVQTAVLGNVDRGMELAYAQALHRLARELEQSETRHRLAHEKDTKARS